MTSGFVLVPITPRKRDPAWKHCQLFKNGDKVLLKCIHCNKLFKGAGIHRIKEHLACLKPTPSTCRRVPPQVQDEMRDSLEGGLIKNREKQKHDQEITNSNATEEDSDHLDVNSAFNGEVPPASSGLSVYREDGMKDNKRKRWRLNDVPILCGGIFSSESDKNELHMAIGRFLYDIGASPDAVNSIHFRPMVNAIISAGPRLELPTYHDLRSWILKNLVEEARNNIVKCKATGEGMGFSVLVDQYENQTGRTYLSFRAYSPEGLVFLKSVDATKIMNFPDDLCELITKVVDEIGARHVLQVISNSDDRYTAVGKRLTEIHPTLYWTPCATQCIDLILDDFGNIDSIKCVIEQGRTITRFVYNHSAVLNMFRRCTFGKDIVEQSITRSASNFTTLKRMVELKHSLQAMIKSQDWMDCQQAKSPGGLEMVDIVNSQSFWSSCILINRLTDPLVRVLRIASSKRRPSMGYVSAGLYRAKERIKSELVSKEEYEIYSNIIDHRYEQLSKHPLHLAGFYLNPKFFYSIQGDMQSEIVSGMFDCVERLVSDTCGQDEIVKEMNLYKNAVGDLGSKMAIRARDTLLPVEWWSAYSRDCPNLARLAIRILSQTCSLINCRRNQILLKKIHETRNQLERQRLDDLLLVHHSLHGSQMVDEAIECDPVDLVSSYGMNFIEDWVKKNDSWVADCENSDWKELDPSSCAVNVEASEEDFEALAAGFDDSQIHERRRETKEEKQNLVDVVIQELVPETSPSA